MGLLEQFFAVHQGRWIDVLLDQLGFSVTCTRESSIRRQRCI